MTTPKEHTVSRKLFEEAPLGPPTPELSLSLESGEELPVRSELLPGSSSYPPQLRELADVPKKLYALGNVALLGSPALAIVGARKATAYGLECAERFAKRAARLGITVVSGGAIGCDMAAHRGALRAGGATAVVLGSGADVVYPLRARSLFKEVLGAGGVLLSEAPWGSPPLAWAFSRRNRIIAALAQATLIVEAGLPSGTFQTADHTLALGNEVLVVPGPIFSGTCRGTNRLLLQGAWPVVDEESFDDALERIFSCLTLSGGMDAGGGTAGAQEAHEAQETQRTCAAGGGNEAQGTCVASGSNETQRTCAAGGGNETLAPEQIRLRQMTACIKADLGASPMTIDALVQAHGWNTIETVRIVSTLEIQGEVIRQRDGRYLTKPGKDW